MAKLMAAFVAVANLVKNNPALAAALVNLGVLLASYFGLHITGDQLIYVTGIATVILGTLVRALVTPSHKVPPPVTNVTNVVHLPANITPEDAKAVGAEVAKGMAQVHKPRKRASVNSLKDARPSASKDAVEIATEVMNPVKDVHPKNGIDKPAV